jgi:hypothetical protein
VIAAAACSERFPSELGPPPKVEPPVRRSNAGCIAGANPPGRVALVPALVDTYFLSGLATGI